MTFKKTFTLHNEYPEHFDIWLLMHKLIKLIAKKSSSTRITLYFPQHRMIQQHLLCTAVSEYYKWIA